MARHPIRKTFFQLVQVKIFIPFQIGNFVYYRHPQYKNTNNDIHTINIHICISLYIYMKAISF